MSAIVDDARIPDLPCRQCGGIARYRRCHACGGDGAAAEPYDRRCRACDGRGGHWRCATCERRERARRAAMQPRLLS